MFYKKDWLTNPKVWRGFIGAMIGLFVVMTFAQIVTGVSNAELETRRMELNQAQNVSTVQNQDEALSLRENRVEQVADIFPQMREDVQTLVDKENFDAYEETYGRDMRALLEAKLTNGDYSSVEVFHQPVYYIEDTFPVNFVFDGSLHVLAHYDFETDTLIPEYASMEGDET